MNGRGTWWAALFGVVWLTAPGQAMAVTEPIVAVTVVAEGLVPFQSDLSLNEVRGRARDEARRNAIEQAVGVFVRGKSVVHNSQIVDELILSVARGVIEEEQWVEEGIREVRDEKHPGSPGAAYHVKLKAQVRPVRVERRADFTVHGSLDKQIYRNGEEASIKIRSSQPAYVHLFSVTQDGNVTLLLPNRFHAGSLLAADQDLIFPSDGLRAVGVKLRVVMPAGAKKATEYIKVIATRKPIRLVKEETGEGVFHTFSGTEGGMIQDVIRRLAQLDDEDWTEATLPYEVR